MSKTYYRIMSFRNLDKPKLHSDMYVDDHREALEAALGLVNRPVESEQLVIIETTQRGNDFSQWVEVKPGALMGDIERQVLIASGLR